MCSKDFYKFTPKHYSKKRTDLLPKTMAKHDTKYNKTMGLIE